MKLINKWALASMTAAVILSAVSCSSENNYAPAENKDNNAALENIYTRTSVREYTGRQIPEDTITILLKAGMSAPTAMNKQPWKFIVVNNQNVRNKLGEAIPGVGDKVRTAGAVILVCGDKSKFIEEAPEYWVQDCSAATENILLAANACNLGAVWCGVYPVQERVNQVQSILNLNGTDLVPLNIITIGYPTALHTPKDKWDAQNVVVVN